jgi:hypothetical protein
MIEQPLFGRVSRFLLGLGVGALATLYLVRAGVVTQEVSLLPLVYFLLLIVTAGLLGQVVRAERERPQGLAEDGLLLARAADRRWPGPERTAGWPQRPGPRPSRVCERTDAP